MSGEVIKLCPIENGQSNHVAMMTTKDTPHMIINVKEGRAIFLVEQRKKRRRKEVKRRKKKRRSEEVKEVKEGSEEVQ